MDWAKVACWSAASARLGMTRAVATSALPVVSAVGHEVDFTICDFVADVRAATPSAAAEIITAGAVSLRERLSEVGGRISRGARRGVRMGQGSVEQFGKRLLRCHPRRRLHDQMQRMDELTDDLRRGLRMQLRELAGKWKLASERMRRVKPRVVMMERREAAGKLQRKMALRMAVALREKRRTLDHLVGALRLLAPDQVLGRGYSITADAKTGLIIRGAALVKKGQKLWTRVADGEFESTAD